MARIGHEIFTMPSVMYSLYIYREELSDEDVTALLNALRYYKRKFPGVSFFMGVSNTDSGTAQRKVVRTGKRGRPRTVVEGKVETQHAHIRALGEEAYSFMQKVKKAVDKRFFAEVGSKVCKVVSKSKYFHGIDYLIYAHKQSKPFYTGGNFDFGRYINNPIFQLNS
jgi:hypothetical protein